MGYIAPKWQNGGPPAINAERLQAISNSLEYVSGNMVNPNLLDNWYFGNAVNQRGFTEAVSDGSYTIDRWKFVTGSTQKLAYAKGAGLSFIVEGGSSNVWTQIVEKLELSLLGRVVTGSLLLSDGTLLTQSGLVGETGFSVGDTSDVYCWVGTDAFNIISKRIGTTTAVAAKLELGSAQTLAHQDADGNWVLNEIPDYGMEMMKCQRYCRPASLGFIISDSGLWYATALMTSPYPMRAVPAIVNGDYTAVKLMSATGNEIGNIAEVFTPTKYGSFTMRISPTMSGDLPSLGTIYSTGFNPLLSADL